MKPLTTDFLFNETGCINSDVLLKYRDHQLTEVEKHAVEEHLVDCELCSDALDGLAKVHAATLSEVTLSVKQLTLEDKKHPGRKLFSVAAVIAGCCLVSFFLYQQYMRNADERIALHKVEVSNEAVDEGAAATISETFSHDSGISASAPAVDAALPADMPPSSDTSVPERQSQKQSVTEKEETIAAVPERSLENEKASASGFSDITSKVYSADNENAENVLSEASVTYIDNLKVVDYNQGGAVQAVEADKPRSAAMQSYKKTPATQAAEPNSVNERPAEPTYQDELKDALALFNKGRYESSLRAFGKLLEKNPEDINAKYYSALSNFHLARYQSAANDLAPFVSKWNPFYEEGRYYYALSLTRTNEKDKGRAILKQISEENGIYSTKAKEELKK